MKLSDAELGVALGRAVASQGPFVLAAVHRALHSDARILMAELPDGRVSLIVPPLKEPLVLDLRRKDA